MNLFLRALREARRTGGALRDLDGPGSLSQTAGYRWADSTARRLPAFLADLHEQGAEEAIDGWFHELAGPLGRAVVRLPQGEACPTCMYLEAFRRIAGNGGTS